MKVLFIGDIIGKLGRQVCLQVLPDLKQLYAPDLIIANGENSAHGYGITEKIYKEMLEMGVDVLTMGNHMWDKRELAKNIDNYPTVVRPANYPPGVPGQDHLIIEKNGVKAAIVNVVGRTFMQAMDCPFQAIDKLLPKLQKETRIIIVDMHAEATSEKTALAWYLDGSVSAVLGTHTHVMTADERILPQGTAFICDVGMAGAYNSIIGMEKGPILKRFLTQMPERFEPSEKDAGLFNAVYLEIDDATGQTKKIERIIRVLDEK
ncbi:metallophosphoesterase [candidate division WOR-1 bacterium RIFOXYB2_FULL_42_35]|uniref:Metallophosphoesterase n=1 Tax=candidate division WOR-1 bacterium RIFOXYC2_FULL_41_25 TaxID=1802586 RepID=A0A1F4TQH6_UNCSA|nr:MAG: metallophosphoesterase [candidate division WOR-1 bacterium RIFOXYA2_FULL_41_14]OGC25552.1 MAG: metallophosphoesterase [candidate division WOR-1 bacterium RIFOXYB2_FULL_42_35]OGC34984.1 MAG: metallophosphoesterase [candidate division WOR-1 bacterium RIFOXYC2_FULL_41_25]